MNSKNLMIFSLLISLCASLFVNAFFYTQTLGLRRELDDANAQIDDLNSQINSTKNTKAFVFEWLRYDPDWAPHNQEIVNGTLRMEINFTLKSDGNLSTILKINDDDYNRYDTLVMLFDRNGDGIVGSDEDYPGLLLLPNNQTNPYAVLSEWGPSFPSLGYFPSQYHNCTYTEEGYAFTILTTMPKNDLIYVGFFDADVPYPRVKDVYVYFRFGIAEAD